MHDLIAAGVVNVRRRNRWTQEDAARAFRYYGLSSWRTGTVGQLEAGLRRPRLEEVLLICAALECTLDQLLPDSDNLIELGDGAMMSAAAVRALLCGDLADGTPPEAHADTYFPGYAAAEAALARAHAEVQEIKPLLEPIMRRSASLTGEDLTAALEFPDDAERHAARRLGIHPSQVKLVARALWGRDFAKERDARIDGAQELEPRSLQAHRGIETRPMLAEIRSYLDEIEPAEGEKSR